MAQLTRTQRTNVLAQLFVKNEAAQSQWYQLNNAGFKSRTWQTGVPIVSDVYHKRISNLTGNSGFSMGVVQLDFSVNKLAKTLAESIRDQAIVTGHLSSEEGKALYDALTQFHARNLDGYASAADYKKGIVSQIVRDDAQKKLSLIRQNEALIENLSANDPVVRAAFDKANYDQLTSNIGNAERAVSYVEKALAKSGESSSLISADKDKIIVALADMENQLGNSRSAQAWLIDHPDATWAEFQIYNGQIRPVRYDLSDTT